MSLFAALAALTAPALGADLDPGLEAQLAASYWRLGLNANIKPSLRLPLWEEEGNVLRQGTGVTLGGDLNLTPAYTRAGAKLTVSPLAIVDLGGYAYYDYYYGNFSTLVGYDSASEDYGSDDDVEAYAATEGRQAGGGGFHAGGSLKLKAKVDAGGGALIVLLYGDLGAWQIPNPGVDGGYFFERENEVMMAFGGDLLLNTAGLVLYELGGDPDSGRVTRVGLLNTYRATVTAGDALERVGPIAQYTHGDGRYAHTVIVQPYLLDRAMPLFPPFFAYAFKLTL